MQPIGQGCFPPTQWPASCIERSHWRECPWLNSFSTPLHEGICWELPVDFRVSFFKEEAVFDHFTSPALTISSYSVCSKGTRRVFAIRDQVYWPSKMNKPSFYLRWFMVQGRLRQEGRQAAGNMRQQTPWFPHVLEDCRSVLFWVRLLVQDTVFILTSSLAMWQGIDILAHCLPWATKWRNHFYEELPGYPKTHLWSQPDWQKPVLLVPPFSPHQQQQHTAFISLHLDMLG